MCGIGGDGMTRQPLLSKPKAKRQYPETALQRVIVQHLMLRGAPDMEYFAVPNGVKLAQRTAAHQISIGMRAGVSDLVIEVGGIVHYMEVKAKGGKQSDAQKAFQDRALKRGAAYALVDNIDTALQYLETWNAIRPRTKTSVSFERAA